MKLVFDGFNWIELIIFDVGWELAFCRSVVLKFLLPFLFKHSNSWAIRLHPLNRNRAKSFQDCKLSIDYQETQKANHKTMASSMNRITSSDINIPENSKFSHTHWKKKIWHSTLKNPRKKVNQLISEKPNYQQVIRFFIAHDNTKITWKTEKLEL